MTIFTSDSGEKFEFVEEAFPKTSMVRNSLVIRPIKSKYEILLMGNVIQIVFNPKPDSDQAQRIEEAVEALMEYINSTSNYTLSDQQARVLKFSHKARNAIQKGKKDE